jgi:arylsulfatase A-like enzyme
VVDTKADPDAAFRWSCGYAAQVVVLDACLEGVTGLLDDLPPHDRWLIVLCGVRGFPLGEHGRIGGVDDRLFAEQLHVPLLWRFPDGTGRLARSGELVSHLDLLPTLVDWIGGTEFAGTELSAGLATPHRPWLGREAGRNDALDGLSLLPLMRHAASPWRDALVAASTTGGRSIRTADWSLRSEPIGVTDEQPPARAAAEADAWHRELYVRPDDRWEANDVANLCRDDVEALSALVRGR